MNLHQPGLCLLKHSLDTRFEESNQKTPLSVLNRDCHGFRHITPKGGVVYPGARQSVIGLEGPYLNDIARRCRLPVCLLPRARRLHPFSNSDDSCGSNAEGLEDLVRIYNIVWMSAF